MSFLIGDNLVVTMHYTLKNDAGEVLDSSEGADPLSYLHGAGNIIPGLEAALVGKTAGDSCDVTVQPEDGYGEVLPHLVQTLSRDLFQGVDTIEVGMAFQAQAPDGSVRMVEVKDVQGDDIIIDANHPLAGQVLHFSVSIENVREATEEERAHGHVH